MRFLIINFSLFYHSFEFFSQIIIFLTFERYYSKKIQKTTKKPLFFFKNS